MDRKFHRVKCSGCSMLSWFLDPGEKCPYCGQVMEIYIQKVYK